MLYKLVLLVTVCFVSPSEAFSHHYPALNRRTVVTQVALARTEEFDSVVPRLHPDVNGLVEWIENDDNKGIFDAAINENSGSKGWTLVALEPVKPNTILIRIPKKLCIFSEPELQISPLLDNTKQLMNSMSGTQWRSRLAIALLSERVKPHSFFSPYLRNLPFEFCMPVFFNSSEFR